MQDLFGEIGWRECNSELLENKCGIIRAASIECTFQFGTLVVPGPGYDNVGEEFSGNRIANQTTEE